MGHKADSSVGALWAIAARYTNDRRWVIERTQTGQRRPFPVSPWLRRASQPALRLPRSLGPDLFFPASPHRLIRASSVLMQTFSSFVLGPLPDPRSRVSAVNQARVRNPKEKISTSFLMIGKRIRDCARDVVIHKRVQGVVVHPCATSQQPAIVAQLFHRLLCSRQ